MGSSDFAISSALEIDASDSIRAPNRPGAFHVSVYAILAGILAIASLAFPSGFASAQPAPATPPPPPSASAPTLSANWPDLLAPDSDSPRDWLEFAKQLKQLSPTTPQQTIELKLALQQTSQRIMDLLQDSNSDPYLQAQSDYFAASAMLLATQPDDVRLASYEKYHHYLSAKPSIQKQDLETILTTCLYLEPFEDKSLARRAYSELAELLVSKNPIAYADFAELLKQNALRLQVGKPFQIQSRTMDGKPFDLEKMRGKRVLLFFWSSSSKPAMDEFPALLELHTQYRDQGFAVVGVALDESAKSARSALLNLNPPWPTNPPWPNVWDDRKQGVIKVMQNYGINSIPTLILLDPELRMLSFEANSQSLRASLERALTAASDNQPTKE